MQGISRQHTDGTSGYSHEEENYGGIKPQLSIPTRVPGRDRSPGLHWHKEYTPETKLHSRILMIDYLRKDVTQKESEGRVVKAQEIHDIRTLKAVYKDGRDLNLTLRVFHVQNCSWATKFLIHKFRIRDNDNIVGLQEFGDWLTHKRPQKRAGKPLLVGESWRTTVDPWRGVAKCSFGLDYMKHYNCNAEESPKSKESRMMGLNGYDSNDNPAHRYDVHSQRMSAYIQYALPESQNPGPDVISPYQGLGTESLDELYDNGHTIIVFDNSETHSIYDALIPARGEWEIRWRRLPFYITNDEGEESEVTLECMKVITQDIFTAVADCWDRLLDVSWEHVSILEEKIYEQPADESRAPELWLNSANWLKYEKLMFAHIDVVNDMRKYLVDIDGDRSDEGHWLKESQGDFERLSNLIQEDLLKRTNNLSELMYKSVGIRDARESLQLGTSMWRLSWITFIFLPLTFIVGFFGMNVDTFEKNPSIAWYFIVALPFMLGVFISWYLLKHWLGRYRQSSHERGIYEALYAELQARRPELWSRAGPRTYVRPKTRISKIKWWLIVRWMSPKRLPVSRPAAQFLDGEPVVQMLENEPVGAWRRVKRYFVRRWTSDIELVDPTSGSGDSEMGLFGGGGRDGDEDGGGGDDASVMPTRPTTNGLRPSQDTDIRLADGVDGGRNSGVLVEEQVGERTVNGGTGPQLRVPGDGGGP